MSFFSSSFIVIFTITISNFLLLCPLIGSVFFLYKFSLPKSVKIFFPKFAFLLVNFFYHLTATIWLLLHAFSFDNFFLDLGLSQLTNLQFFLNLVAGLFWSQSAEKPTILFVPCGWICISRLFLKIHPLNAGLQHMK